MLTSFPHQIKVIDRFKDQSVGAILLEMGLGKSRIAIKLAEHKFTKGEITACLILMPKSLLANWLKIENQLHNEQPYNIYSWHSRDHLIFKKDHLQYFLVNHDGIMTERFNEVFKQFYTIHR